MKQKEFKDLIESQKVTDETDITFIDTDMYKPTVHFEVDMIFIDSDFEN